MLNIDQVPTKSAGEELEAVNDWNKVAGRINDRHGIEITDTSSVTILDSLTNDEIVKVTVDNTNGGGDVDIIVDDSVRDTVTSGNLKSRVLKVSSSIKLQTSNYTGYILNNSRNSPATNTPRDLADDGNDLYVCDANTLRIYKMNGYNGNSVSNLVFSGSANGMFGITWANDIFVTSNYADDLIRLHNGFNTTVTSSFATPSFSCHSLTYDETLGNLLSFDNLTENVSVHSGVTPTVTETFSLIDHNSIGFDRDTGNLLSTEANYAYIHDGISSTILESFSNPNSAGSGQFWGVARNSSDNQFVLHDWSYKDLVTVGKEEVLAFADV